jgi:hypothetical protein
MDATFSVVTAMLNSITHHDEYDAPVPEVDFVPFDLSYLRDFSGQSEQAEKPVGGCGHNASDALPA